MSTYTNRLSFYLGPDGKQRLDELTTKFQIPASRFIQALLSVMTDVEIAQLLARHEKMSALSGVMADAQTPELRRMLQGKTPEQIQQVIDRVRMELERG